MLKSWVKTQRKRLREKPVRINEVYDIEIKEMGKKGDGVTRIKGFVVFVKNTKIGDQLKIKIIRVSDNFAIAEPLIE